MSVRDHRVTRLRVFAVLKRVMTSEGVCPTSRDVARATGISVGAARRHMNALQGATGLPLPVTAGAEVHAEKLETAGHGDAGHKGGTVSQIRRGTRFDEGAPIEIDLLMREAAP